ncbi:unnamed protein product [Dovyalis caffra]|uniref:Uncharacterized protein n=1 Tax=Dovyalis caffra TaxID=77055 RepID=A0AAV1SDR2_9ROSI|nr:unnamed protein product [Dovyalis caffra]
MRGRKRERHQIQKALTAEKGSPTIQDWYQLQPHRNLAIQSWGAKISERRQEEVAIVDGD